MKPVVPLIYMAMLYCLRSTFGHEGWIQHDLVGGGGGSASSGAELCRSCVPPTHQLASLLQSFA
jgi:hypothetical protein